MTAREWCDNNGGRCPTDAQRRRVTKLAAAKAHRRAVLKVRVAMDLLEGLRKLRQREPGWFPEG